MVWIGDILNNIYVYLIYPICISRPFETQTLFEEMALDFKDTWVMNIQSLKFSPKIISVTMIIVIFAKKKANL